MTEVVVIGDRELLRKLKKLNPRELEAGLLAAGKTVEAAAKEYPPPPPGSTYVRTYALRDNWNVRTQRRDFSVIIENPTEYAPFVQGESQATVHRGRWKTLKKTAESKTDEIVKKLKEQVDRILERG